MDECCTCCFIGHRKVMQNGMIKERLTETIEYLITQKGVDTFLFGSGSEFDALCLNTVTALKGKYQGIKRIYVRAEFPYIDDAYRTYLLGMYDETYFPENLLNAGRAVYVERNRVMVDTSLFCVIFFDEKVSYTKRKSGTKLAFDYMLKKNKQVYNLFLE